MVFTLSTAGPVKGKWEVGMGLPLDSTSLGQAALAWEVPFSDKTIGLQ